MRKQLFIFMLLIGYANAMHDSNASSSNQPASEFDAPVIATIGGASYSTRSRVAFTKKRANIYRHTHHGDETDPYSALAWSPDGKQLVAGWSYELEYTGGMRDGEILSFDKKFKQTSRSDIPLGHVNALAWHPNGRLAIASRRIDIAATNPESKKLSPKQTFEDWTTWSARLCNPPVYDAAWNNDGTKLAFTLRNTVRILQPEIQQYDALSSLAYSLFGLGSQYPQYDSIIELPDTTAKTESLSWDPQDTHSLAFATCNENPVYIYDTRTKQLPHAVTKEPKECTSVAWSPNGINLACGSADGSIRVLDKRTWNVLSTLCAGAAVRSLKWRPNSQTVAVTAGNDLLIWDAAQATILKKLHISPEEGQQMLALAWHPTEETIAGSNNSGAIAIWNLKDLNSN